jgi:O-antigen/teichoic acid export membrane protein
MMYGVLCTVTPVFTTALQALKKFKEMAWFGFITAPLRLVTMLIFMPYRALSGYFVGQSTPATLFIIVALCSLRKHLGRSVRMESYWRQDWLHMVKYTIPVAILVSSGTLQLAVEMFVIRHRLPDVDSAGYYIISRFAEIGGYVGVTLLFVLFPLAAEGHAKGDRSHRLLWHSMGGALVSGLLLAAAFYGVGGWLLSLSSAWKDYVAYTPQLALLTVIFSLRSAIACFTNFEMACGRFRFVGYMTAIACAECALLYGLTGYSFFEGVLPDAWVGWMASLEAARLDFLLQVMFWAAALPLLGIALQMLLRFRERPGRPVCG